MTKMFPTVSGWTVGYHQDQVKEFFDAAREVYEGRSEEELTSEDVRRAAFDLVRGGYRTAEVDASLDRLEAAFIQRERQQFITTHGQDAWMSRVADRATTLYPRLVRPPLERFAHPAKGQGYRKEEVDALLDRLIAYFDSGSKLEAADIRQVTFPAARGKKAYAEGVVDAYLDRAVDVLLAVE